MFTAFSTASEPELHSKVFLGKSPGAIRFSNSANWIVAYMAILMAGGVATLLNGWWRGGELAELGAGEQVDLAARDALGVVEHH